jgi:tripartite-type tricarboxylate transporter receptor subunit TctC
LEDIVTRFVTIRTALAGALSLVLAGAAGAQQPPYPQKSIEMTVLFPAGSSADVAARLLADGMAKNLGQPVIVINRPGAGGAIGYRHVAAQTPDGYSLVWNSNSISTTYHAGQLAFNYGAFDAVAQVLVESPMLAVRSDVKFKTLADIVAQAKAQPRAITVANSGTGSHTHFTSVALFKAAGVEVIDVPFAASQVIPSILGGQVDAGVQLPAALAGNVRAGQMRLLATMTAKRDPAFPDVPTAREQRLDVAFELWRGVAVPKGTPRPVIAALEEAIRKTAASKEFVEACEKLGARPEFLPAAVFAGVVAKGDAEIARLMAILGMKKSI